MKPHSVFLRKDCILPNSLDPLRQPIDRHWTRVEHIPAQIFNTMVRQAGWHLLRTEKFCARSGFGVSRQIATGHALSRALCGVPKHFNAAEFYSERVIGYFGLYVATVTLQPRLTQR